MEQLAVAKVDRHVGDPLALLVDSLVGFGRRAFITHKEDQIASLQAVDAVYGGTVVFDVISLLAGIRRKRKA
ncbi:hypothetical protein D3C76_1467550 [compost metagenome]